MNDFTKEELEKIIIIIDDLMFSKFYAEDTQTIYKKIQSMIDNYCDHKDYQKLYTSAYGIENFGCKECGCQFIEESTAYKNL